MTLKEHFRKNRVFIIASALAAFFGLVISLFYGK